MGPSEALVIAAQIAIALAGFAGVVVVFRRESVHEWSGIDKLRLRRLLANSILPLGLCMLGLLLLTIKPMPLGIWRWCSGIALIATLLFVRETIKSFRRWGLQTCIVNALPGSFLPVRSLGRGCHVLTTVQYCVARRILAIFRW